MHYKKLYLLCAICSKFGTLLKPSNKEIHEHSKMKVDLEI